MGRPKLGPLAGKDMPQPQHIKKKWFSAPKKVGPGSVEARFLVHIKHDSCSVIFREFLYCIGIFGENYDDLTTTSP
jgi:hypothetical protein